MVSGLEPMSSCGADGYAHVRGPALKDDPEGEGAVQYAGPGASKGAPGEIRGLCSSLVFFGIEDTNLFPADDVADPRKGLHRPISTLTRTPRRVPFAA